MTDIFGNPEQVVIAYHANCIDGFTSAWVVDRFFRQYEGGSDATITLLPMEYNERSYKQLYDTIAKVKAKFIYIVDFSVSYDWLTKYTAFEHNSYVVVLDHHKTAFENYMGPDYIVHPDSFEFISDIQDVTILLDNANSGAGMCWNYFHERTDTPPLLIQHVQDYDLWKFNMEDTRPLARYFRSLERTLDTWDVLYTALESPLLRDNAVVKGWDLEEEHRREVTHIAALAKPITLHGLHGYIIDCSYEYVSDVGSLVAKMRDAFCAMPMIPDPVHPVKETTMIPWSLRSKGDLDVSKLAAYYGGGGHKNAAGFELDYAATMRLLKLAKVL